MKAGAGANLSKLVLRSVREGYGGMEPLTGIPGTIGGAVRMNAGGAFGDIGNIVEAVHLMDTDGTAYTRHRGDLLFGLRVDLRKSDIRVRLGHLFVGGPERSAWSTPLRPEVDKDDVVALNRLDECVCCDINGCHGVLLLK